MKKVIVFLIISTIIKSIIYCQYLDSVKVFLIEYQKVIFRTSDSTYKFTRFIAPNGKFYFQEGFVDSGYYCDGYFYGYSGFITPPGNYRLLCEKSSLLIDTINCYVPVKDAVPNEDSTINVADELTYSYVLKKFGNPDKINQEKYTLRIIFPCEYFGFNTFYNVFKINFYKDSVRFYRLSGQSVDYNGIQLKHIDSSLLRKRDVDNIMKELNLIKVIEGITCRKPGNPWLLEYNDGSEYKRFIISNYCLHREKNLKQVLTFCNRILELGDRYFGVNCSLSP